MKGYNFNVKEETVIEDSAMNVALAIEDLIKATKDVDPLKKDFNLLRRYSLTLISKIGHMQHDGYL